MLTVHCIPKDIGGDAWSRRCASTSASSDREGVWLCDACERSPAAFLCQADSASLCPACDADVHSANPLARRHRRVPIPSLPTRVSTNPGGLIIGRPGDVHDDGFLSVDAENSNELDEDETASWLLFNNNGDDDGKGVFGAEVDKYFDLEDYTDNNPFNYGAKQEQYSSDSVVPNDQFHDCNNQWRQLVSVVPESSMAEASMIPQTRGVCKGTIDLFSGPPVHVPEQLSSVDREARVLRYREKKKNRKFEKTIRYASRKAYAESRPRIKGRFAKRNEVEVEVDQMFAYSVVASF